MFAEAAYRAATTLALILPAVIVPLLFTQFEDDLNPAHLAFIGSNEYGVWATPEGIPFVDPLAAAKPKAPVANKKSKEADIEQWEAELREALARKKPVAATLSKADRLLLERQLAKESETRAQMAEALGRLRRGFALLLCLVNSRADLVKEYLATMVNTVLTVIVSRPATLVAEEAFATYQVSSTKQTRHPSVLIFAGLRRPSEIFAPTDSDSPRSLSVSPSSVVLRPKSSPRTTSPRSSLLSSLASSTAFATSRSSSHSMPARSRTAHLWSARFCDPEESDWRRTTTRALWSSWRWLLTLSHSMLVNVRLTPSFRAVALD